LSWLLNRKTEGLRLGQAEGEQSTGFLYDQRSLDSGSCRFKPQQRAHSPQLAAGLASDIKIRLKALTVEDYLQLLLGSSNLVK
jgi:hypothetical protein